MSITIRTRDQKPQIQLREEVWEFPDFEQMRKALDTLLNIKKMFGTLKKEGY